MEENRRWSLTRTPLFSMLWNILLVYAGYMICRIIFIAYYWDQFKLLLDAESTWKIFKGGLVFDTSGIIYTTAIYIILTIFPFHFKENRKFHRFCTILLIILASAGYFCNLGDTVYFQYNGCRTSCQLFREVSNEGGGQLAHIILVGIRDNWYLMLCFAIMIYAMCRLTIVPDAPKYRKLWQYYSARAVITVVTMALCVGGIRGGFATSIRPITMTDAYQYASKPMQAAAVLNTPFCAIRTITSEDISVIPYYSDEELEQIYSPVIMPDSTAVFQPKNVVVMLLESFGSEYIGAMNQGRTGIHDCTPFLDSLMQQSLTCEYSLANGRKSIDIIPTALCGLPYLREHIILSPALMSKEIRGLASELNDKGYYTAFFHGADNQSMGFQAIARASGFQDYFGRTEFEEKPEYGGSKAFDGTWAIWDEEFLQFMCDQIGTFQQPFMTSVFTASSHHPYVVPERYRETYPEEGNLPIYKVVRYSDHALRLFFEKAKTQPWYENTLFVLTADHTNLTEHPDYQSDYGLFKVPVIFFDPTGEIKGHRDCLVQQADITPSILDYLGYDKPFLSFGQSIFSTDAEDLWVANFTNDIWMYYKGDYVIQFDGKRVLGMYRFKEDILLKNNISGTLPTVEEDMQKHLKAIIQQYLKYLAS